MNRRAFTLLETMIVLLIVALLAASVALNPAQWFQSARMSDAVDRVVFVDRTARQSARRSGTPIEMVFDLRRGQVTRREQGEQRGPAQRLPSGYTFDRLLVRGVATEDQGMVPVSERGATPTYAFCVRAKNGEACWVLVAGLTGQVLTFNSESEINHVFQTLSP